MPNETKSQSTMKPWELWKQWNEMTTSLWANAIQNGKMTGMDSSLISAFRHASEAYIRALSMPTLSDLTHVAELVVNLEEKVDTIGDTLEQVKKQVAPDTAVMAKLTALEQQMNHMETKLDTLVPQTRAKQGSRSSSRSSHTSKDETLKSNKAKGSQDLQE